MTSIYTLTIVQKALEQICNEMTITLTKTAYSPNIKERRDFSCALFTYTGDLMSSKEGIPVHLGSMEDAVKSVIEKIKTEEIPIYSGDVFIHNNVYEGGTHLPDINLLSPIFIDGEEKPSYYAACRAHHADVGGKSPGSMPAHSETLFEEGIQIPGVKLWEKGDLRNDILKLILANVRTQKERKGDFYAQRSALIIAERRLQALNSKYGKKILSNLIKKLFTSSEEAMRKFISRFPDDLLIIGVDYLDFDGIIDEPVKIAVTISKEKDNINIDFKDTAKQREANCNATSAITKSCVFYVFKFLLSEWGDFPTNSGLFSPLLIQLPTNSVVNASFPYATSSGNVETSQRIVDVLFKALSNCPFLKIPAASQGTMNNIIIGGIHKGSFFTYYETIAGGSGALSDRCGTNAIHTNMTNTLNTPIEALELNYPLRINQYKIRESSGGNGKHKGGDGLIREYENLAEKFTLNIQSERRKFQPYGLQGGDMGMNGKNILIKKTQDKEILLGRVSRVLEKGDRIIIETPGGGGYGKN